MLAEKDKANAKLKLWSKFTLSATSLYYHCQSQTVPVANQNTEAYCLLTSSKAEDNKS